MAIPRVIDEAEPMNLTPMMDIVFNILIFFMLGSTIANEESELELQLPSVGSAAPLTESPEELVVNVHQDGRITIRNEEYSIEALETFLNKARQNYPEQAISLRGHAAVPYQRVADVIALCRQTGIVRLDVRVLEEH